jgi:hypothetical protein
MAVETGSYGRDRLRYGVDRSRQACLELTCLEPVSSLFRACLDRFGALSTELEPARTCVPVTRFEPV